MFVQLHIDLAAAEEDALSLQAEALLKSGISREFDLATRAQHAVPGQAGGAVQGSRHLASTMWESCGAGDRTVSSHLATRNLANHGQDAAARGTIHGAIHGIIADRPTGH